MMTAAVAAPAQQAQVKVTFYTDAYWYKPGGKARLSVTLENMSQQTLEGVAIRLRVHSPNGSRADLDSALEESRENRIATPRRSSAASRSSPERAATGSTLT